VDITTAIVWIVAIVLACGVVVFALYRKGDVKAGGTFGNGSFFLDVKDRKRGRK
jgi:hypothetical protein